MPRLLIIGAGPAQAPIIEAAKALGLDLIVADDRAAQPALRHAARVLPINRYDEVHLLAAASELRPDGVVSGGADRTVAIAARAAEALGLPTYVSSSAAALSSDKGRLRQLYRGWNVAAPMAIEPISEADVRRAVEQIGYPLVVKPADGIGQAGVNRVDAPPELAAAVRGARAAAKNGRIVVEQFLAGRELGVNAYVFAGRSMILSVGERIAQKEAGASFGVALRKMIPADVTASEFERIGRLLQKVAKGLGLAGGPMYAQIMLTGAGPFVIEAMPRLGGGEDARLVAALTGFDMADAVVREALGWPVVEPPSLTPSAHRVGLIQFLTAAPGTIIRLAGIERARALKGIVTAAFYVSVGDNVGTVSSSRERLGFVCATGSSLEEAEEATKAALAEIRIETE